MRTSEPSRTAPVVDGWQVRIVRPNKVRIDLLMVERGLAKSREQARQLVMRRVVQIAGQPVEKPGQLIARSAMVTVTEPARFVSRGGDKLEGALAAFGIPVEGRIALDVGASTGGFTDCLLQRGARKVYAIDVGYGQFAWPLRQDPRVIVMERKNIRTIRPGDLSDAVSLVTADLSFISLRLILPVLRPLLSPLADLIVLVKPQFEVGRQLVGRGGVVRDQRLRQEAVTRIADAAEKAGYQVRANAPSVLPGSKGNQEHFLWLTYSAQETRPAEAAAQP